MRRLALHERTDDDECSEHGMATILHLIQGSTNLT